MLVYVLVVYVVRTASYLCPLLWICLCGDRLGSTRTRSSTERHPPLSSHTSPSSNRTLLCASRPSMAWWTKLSWRTAAPCSRGQTLGTMWGACERMRWFISWFTMLLRGTMLSHQCNSVEMQGGRIVVDFTLCLSVVWKTGLSLSAKQRLVYHCLRNNDYVSIYLYVFFRIRVFAWHVHKKLETRLLILLFRKAKWMKYSLEVS